MIDLKTVFNTPDNVVYVLINEEAKRVMVVATSDMFASLGRIKKGIQENDKSLSVLRGDTEALKFVIVETDVERDKLRVRYNYWVDHYVGLGYTLYKEPKNRVKYRFVIATEVVQKQLLVVAYLVSKRNTKIKVGQFNTLREAEKFRALYYKDQTVYDIVFSRKELELEYYNKMYKGIK